MFDLVQVRGTKERKSPLESTFNDSMCERKKKRKLLNKANMPLVFVPVMVGLVIDDIVHIVQVAVLLILHST